MDGGLIRTLQHNSILFLSFLRRHGPAPGAPPAARPAENAGSSISPPLHFAFQSPANARVGEAFDIRVFMETHQAIGRIVLDIAFDPALLRCESPRRSTIRTGLLGSSRFPSIERRPSHRRDGARSEHGRLDAPDEHGCRPVRSLGAGLDANRHRKYQRFGRYGSIPFVDRVRTGKPDRDQLTPGAPARGRSRAE